MQRLPTSKPRLSVSRKRLILAGIAALALPLGADVAHAQAGIDRINFSKLFDPLEGAVLSNDYENVRVPEVPERFCSQAEKDKLLNSLLSAQEAAQENIDQALISQQILNSEIKTLEHGAKAMGQYIDCVTTCGTAEQMDRAKTQTGLYKHALKRVRTALGAAQAEEMHFGVTVERIDSNLEILEATKITDCAKEKLGAFGAARSAAPQFPGVKLNAQFQPGLNLSYGAQFTDKSAESALDETMSMLNPPAPATFAKKDPLKIGVNPYQGGSSKFQLSAGAQYNSNQRLVAGPAPVAPTPEKPVPGVAKPRPKAPAPAAATPAQNAKPQNAKPGQRTQTINLGFAQPYAGPTPGGG